MATWVLLAALSQLINAGIVFIDKYVLAHKQALGKPIVYAFYISILSGVVIVVAPFGVSLPSQTVVILSLVSAGTFMASIYCLYTALKEGHASDIMPVVGSVSAIATALLAYQWLTHDLPRGLVPAITFMVVGMLLISHYRLTWRQRIYIVIAGIFFGITAFLTKLIFTETDFLNGFFWSRMGNVAAALALIAIPANRHAIFGGYKHSSGGTKWLVISNKTLSGIAAALTLFATSLGSVSVVQALAGLQFVFLIVIAYLFSSHFPKVFSGELERNGLSHKIAGIVAIVIGLALLFLI